MTPEKTIIEKINGAIQYQQDTLLNHLKTVLKSNNNLSGEITNHKFKIWKYSKWSGMLYIVLTGEVKVIDGKEKVIISGRFNKVARLSGYITFSGFIFALYIA